MSKRIAIVLVGGLLACGTAHETTPRKVELASSLIAASAANDVAAVQKIVRKPLVLGGLWFTEPACITFTQAGEVSVARLPQLAQCLTALHLQASPRADELPDVVAMTYGPGIEVEARFMEDAEGPWLAWIGFEARRDLRDALPTVSAATFESARTAGTRDGAVDPVAGASLLAHAKAFSQDTEYAWLKVCLDAEGQIASVKVREASSFAAAAVFTANANAWAFRPIVAGGHPIPACAMVEMVYPAAKHPAEEKLPLALPDAPADAIFVPWQVLGTRVAGTRAIHPTEDDTRRIMRSGVGSVTGSFAYCLDEHGAVASVTELATTGLASYDAVLTNGIQQWRFAPYVEGGHAARVCSSASFVYKVESDGSRAPVPGPGHTGR